MKFCAVVLACVTAPAAFAFSLLGPFTSWQVTALGYNLPGDIGGPMNLNEGFRWNVPVIYYAYDKSFIDYFGPRGIQAVDEAISYFNDLPPANKMSADLSEYSTQTLRQNAEAGLLGIIDVKSTVMSLLMEEIGFTDPIRYVFTLRGRNTETIGGVTITNYTTIMRNFDPVTLTPSRYVNGVLYTYRNMEFRNPDHADAVEEIVFAPEGVAATPVASAGTFSFGTYRVGLSRDDVGGIRFLYHPNNYAVETLVPGITLGLGVGNRSAWVPFTGITNATTVTNQLIGGTNGVIDIGLRGGRNKLRFQKVFFDYIFGQTFTPITNQFTDVTVGTNLTLVVQGLQRGVVQPDIIFVAEDLGLAGNLVPVYVSRTSPDSWIDNDAINGNDEIALSHGPGVIAPQIRISLTDQLPYFETSTGSAFLDDFPGEDTAFFSGVWGSFDGSTNPPVIYPQYQHRTIQQLRQQILRGGGR